MDDAPATPALPSTPPVARVRAHYAALCAAAGSHFGTGSLAGRLLLIDGLAHEGDALLIAASIAGAASLTLETRTEAVRHCVRNGIVDFAVSTLDEALRILKNEIRKQQPIAVLLEREPAGVLAEMAERGAQPDILRWAAPDPAIDTLRDRGARPFPPPLEKAPDPGRDVCWRAGDGGSAVLRQLDMLAVKRFRPAMPNGRTGSRARRVICPCSASGAPCRHVREGARGLYRGSGGAGTAGSAGCTG